MYKTVTITTRGTSKGMDIEPETVRLFNSRYIFSPLPAVNIDILTHTISIHFFAPSSGRIIQPSQLIYLKRHYFRHHWHSLNQIFPYILWHLSSIS